MKLKQLLSPKSSLPEKWEIVSITYAPPRRDISGLEFENEETRKMALFGVTTFFFQEVNSGKTRQDQVLGTDKIMLEELINKVEIYGPQNFKSETTGKIYTIKPFQDPNLTVSDLPVRYDKNIPQFNQTPQG